MENQESQQLEDEITPEMAAQVENIQQKMKDWVPAIAANQSEFVAYIKKIISKCNRNRINRETGKRSWPCKGCPMWHGKCFLDIVKDWKEEIEDAAD